MKEAHLEYRGGFISQRELRAGWAWRRRQVYYYEVVIGTHWLLWRIRSDDEALRILCEKVDELLDTEKRAEAFSQERQAVLDERSKIMREIENGL